MQNGVEVDVDVVVTGDADGGVHAGQLLMAFVDTALTRDSTRTSEARGALSEVIGEQAVVDAAAVAAMFQLNTRAADAVGILVEERTRESRSAMGVQLGFGARADGRAL